MSKEKKKDKNKNKGQDQDQDQDQGQDQGKDQGKDEMKLRTPREGSVGAPETPPVTAQPLPILPIRNSVLFPHMMMPLAVGRASSMAAVEAALGSEDKTLAIVCQDDAAVDRPSRDDLFDYGTVAVIKKAERSGDDVSMIVQGLQRVRLTEATQSDPFLIVHCVPAPIANERTTEVEALHREMVDLATKIAEQLEGNAAAGVVQMLTQVEDPLQVAYLLASVLGIDAKKARALLAADGYSAALRLMHEFLTHELHVHRLRRKISSSAQSEMSRQQREYYLRRQLEAIQEELGESTPEQAEAAELRRRLDEASLPDNVRRVAEKELSRLERMSPNAADYQLTRTYMDLVLELPWTAATDDNLDLRHARQILDEDHFDLKEVKERIVEHLAVMKLNPRAKAPILCFVGPPGVGKTSLGKSIARALGRKFERLALGGLHDEAELRGHRRTYIGAMPGRIIQAVRRAESRNPLLMLDEIDKLGRDFRGDPAAALMEILDPEQNAEFHDNYLDLPFDLSNVFFVTTANTLENIPRPLLDRMELLRLAGYSGEEKQQIARQYLIPRQIKEAGLSSDQLTIPDETLRYIVGHYTREAGVRELERTFGRIARKIAMRVVEQGAASSAGDTAAAEGDGAGEAAPPRQEADGSFKILPDDLAELLGPEKFYPETARKKLAPGVAAGLAWTEAGGEVLYVESVLLPDTTDLKLTGQLGEVMKESAQAARSFVLAHLSELDIDKDRVAGRGIHVHVPAGAIRKDGPSAGITMATAIASLLTHHPVRSDTAMTGEITLSGLVLPVGGIKEKVLAAHRSGMRRVILPRDNEKDLREIPDHVRDALEFVFATRIEEALADAIPDTPEQVRLKERLEA